MNKTLLEKVKEALREPVSHEGLTPNPAHRHGTSKEAGEAKPWRGDDRPSALQAAVKRRSRAA